jgi:hypothetical protein
MGVGEAALQVGEFGSSGGNVFVRLRLRELRPLNIGFRECEGPAQRLETSDVGATDIEITLD